MSKASADQRAPMLTPSVPLLRILSFFSGGAVMVVEFSGNRLLAPAFGNSLYTWTGLIGVILVALSCGDYLGGWLVDRYPHRRLLALPFILGGGLTALIPGLIKLMPDLPALDLVWGPVGVSLGLFFLPGLFLAAVTPISIRMLSMASADHHVGRSAGTVGMAAALGSFAGTIGTSYVLIPNFGVRQLLILLGALLVAIGALLALLWWKPVRSGATAAVLGALLLGAGAMTGRKTAPRPEIIFEQETFYHRIVVEEQRTFGDRVRLLKLDSTYEGAQLVTSGELSFGYQAYWRLAEVFCPDLDRAIFLGAGAFGMPEQLSKKFPAADIDVVEIDPAVIEVGRRFFRLDEFPKVRAHAADGRRFLHAQKEPAGLIFGDAYNGVQYIPAHLVTREFFALVGSRLSGDGVFIMNLIGSVEGDASNLFWRVHNSLRPAFLHLHVYGTIPQNPFAQQNLIIVASAAPLDPRVAEWQRRVGMALDPALDGLLRTRIELPAGPEERGMFTDDRNPVEWIVAQQLRRQR